MLSASGRASEAIRNILSHVAEVRCCCAYTECRDCLLTRVTCVRQAPLDTDTPSLILAHAVHTMAGGDGSAVAAFSDEESAMFAGLCSSFKPADLVVLARACVLRCRYPSPPFIGLHTMVCALFGLIGSTKLTPALPSPRCLRPVRKSKVRRFLVAAVHSQSSMSLTCCGEQTTWGTMNGCFCWVTSLKACLLTPTRASSGGRGVSSRGW